MLVNPHQKLLNKIFYNNICMILCIFSIICFMTSYRYNNSVIKQQEYTNIEENILFGPIEVKDKNSIYQIQTHFSGLESSIYLSGEVLDEDKDTVYEFGKDLWHESGYDGGEHYDESERNMTVDLAFTEKGKYYIQFRTEDDSVNAILNNGQPKRNIIPNVTITIKLKKGSYVPHFQAGMLCLILTFMIWYIINAKWMNEKMCAFSEKLEEMSDD